MPLRTPFRFICNMGGVLVVGASFLNASPEEGRGDEPIPLKPRPEGRPSHGPPGMHPGGARGGSPRLGAGRELIKADLDQDGVISFTEFSAMARLASLDEEKRGRLYSFLDKDGDGSLQVVELRPREPRWVSSLKDEFVKFDKDESLDLSFEEFSELPAFVEVGSERLKHLFTELDKDKSGALTRQEAVELRRGGLEEKIDFKKYDINESGGLDKSEYLQLPLIHRIPKDHVEHLFVRIDENKDGELTSEEFKQHHKKRGGGRRLPPPE